MKKITAIGGGTGLSTLLRSIRDYPLDISAIVAMTDDGASTGRLRKDLETLPPGDVRQCIAALSRDEGVLLSLFDYRFKKGFGLSGHSFGNLFITALSDITGSFEEAVFLASRILQTQGEIIPATYDNIHLSAFFDNGKKIIGESRITRYGYNHQIAEIMLNKKAETNKEAIKKIMEADILLVGPGSLYTSIMPNFLLLELNKAFKKSQGLKAYISNVSTERGETDNFKISDHLEVLKKYGVSFDLVIATNSHYSPKEVKVDTNSFFETKIVKMDLTDIKNPLCHDIEKLGGSLWEIIGNIKKIKGGRYDFKQ